MTTPLGAQEILIDNDDLDAVTTEGEWTAVSGAPDRIGLDYLALKPRRAGWVKYAAQLAEAGKYSVEAFWNSHKGSRSKQVILTVYHKDGDTAIAVDQRIDGGMWVEMGTFDFEKDGGIVEISIENADDYVVADAVRFTKVDETKSAAPGPTYAPSQAIATTTARPLGENIGSLSPEELMMDLEGGIRDPATIDLDSLPRVPVEKGQVFAGEENVSGFNLHSYIAFHDGRYWAMWSSGFRDEDSNGQRVRFATSADGITWEKSEFVTPPPGDGFRYIARGFWERDGEFLALASRDESGKFFGASLALQAFRWDAGEKVWKDAGTVMDDTINNFAPKKLPDGTWMMSRRNSPRDVFFAVGGVEALNDWESIPVVNYGDPSLKAEEPDWWVLPDGRLTAIFRDNLKSRRLFRSFSSDMGRTWTPPVRTNFPDAGSKFNGLQLADGRFVFASNPNPLGRVPLTLSVSNDGVVFRQMFVVEDTPTDGAKYPGKSKSRGYQYPNVIEHDGHVFVIYAENKENIRVAKIKVSDLPAGSPVVESAAAVPGTQLPPMLDLPGAGEDPDAIAYKTLPYLDGTHVVVTPPDGRYRLHAYLAWFDGKFWCMWSEGAGSGKPPEEGGPNMDHPGQEVLFATSVDGLTWDPARKLSGAPQGDEMRYIARGFWDRDGRLLALASMDESLNEKGRVSFFGKSLSLFSFTWDTGNGQWTGPELVEEDTINNFPPRRLPNGEWGMTRRDSGRNAYMMTGGVLSPSEWRSWPMTQFRGGDAEGALKVEEPEWWALPDDRLLGVYRDNGGSRRLFRSLSVDGGRTWTPPEKTNFPDATSKFFGIRTSRGYYVLVSNAGRRRNPICLSTSDDGVTFTRMARLPVPATAAGGALDIENDSGTYQYPYVLERGGYLYIAYSRDVKTIEILRVALDEVDRLRNGELKATSHGGERTLTLSSQLTQLELRTTAWSARGNSEWTAR